MCRELRRVLSPTFVESSDASGASSLLVTGEPIGNSDDAGLGMAIDGGIGAIELPNIEADDTALMNILGKTS